MMGNSQSNSINGMKMFLSSLSSKLRYYTLLSIVTFLSHLPFRCLYILSDIIFPFFYSLIRYRRKIVRKNLTETFPDKKTGEIIKIEKRFYHFFIDMALETCKLISISPEEIKQRIRFTNIEVANEKLAEGKSISLFMGHYGNWEWVSTISLWLHEGTIPAQIYKRLSNEAMEKIMKKLRGRWGNVCVDMHQTVRYIADAATDSRPYVIGFIADQSPRKRESKHFIPFLNHDVPVLTGPEKITKHFGYEALFLNIRRVKRGYYECDLSPLNYNPTSHSFELTSLYYQRLEQEITSNPELYLWTHKRFRHAYMHQSPSI